MDRDIGIHGAEGQEGREGASCERLPPLPPVCSDELLQGRRMVAITHNGEVYRLQVTRLGKLILTK